MKRIIPVYIFQQVNVLLVSLYLLKFLCIGELTLRCKEEIKSPKY
ncbi:putative metal-dependent membrane protease [Streptococcus pneumoniae]|nr:putative metal-dependent membrane protease [Streptococcus pneumoniae]